MGSREFAVIGLGNFGSAVAAELSGLKCKVTAIDVNKTRIQELQNKIHLVILGNATERAFLEQLEVEKFDGFIISTGTDSHASILISLHLKELGAKKIIVKANSEDHAKILRKVGATETIIPEKQMAIRLAHSLAASNLVDYLPLTGEFCVAEITPPPKFIDKSLLELKLRKKHNIQLIAIKGGPDKGFTYGPGGDYRIKEGDILVALGRREDIDKIQE
ncbi:MAG: TrkA family potassium uptake protein [candidate division Zixibacteria bacterium]|nr:TrkA family potassium uptake protein [candidate division Zixibacteria bacterium]